MWVWIRQTDARFTLPPDRPKAAESWQRTGPELGTKNASEKRTIRKSNQTDRSGTSCSKPYLQHNTAESGLIPAGLRFYRILPSGKRGQEGVDWFVCGTRLIKSLLAGTLPSPYQYQPLRLIKGIVKTCFPSHVKIAAGSSQALNDISHSHMYTWQKVMEFWGEGGCLLKRENT